MELTSRWQQLHKAWQQLWFAPADPRVYALARIGFAIAALWNMLEYWPIRDECFWQQGSLATQTIQALNGPRYPSLLYWIDSPAGVTLFFIVAMLAAVCLAVGFLTRIAAVTTFIVIISYSYRAYAVTSGNDVLLRVFALLLAISPIDRAFALDERWRRSRGRAAVTSVPAYGLVLMQLQVLVIYEQTVWFKLGDGYWRRGEVMAYFLMSMYSRFPTRHWADWETLSALLSYSTLLIELALPWLLLSRRTRALGFTLGLGMHLAIALLSKLALFSFSMACTYVVFLDRADVGVLFAWARRLTIHLPRPVPAEGVELMPSESEPGHL